MVQKKNSVSIRRQKSYSLSRPKLIFVVCGFAAIGVLAILFSAADSPHPLYSCVSRQANIATPPPVSAPPSGTSVPTVATSEFPAVCPEGKVPKPKNTAGPKHIPSGLEKQGKTNTALEPRASFGGVWFSWAEGTQTTTGLAATQFSAFLSNERPWVNYVYDRAAHSIGQIWGVDNTDPRGYSTVETGWSESLGQFGDTYPHLFIYHFDAGVGMGYAPSGGWVQYSNAVYPNMPVGYNDRFHGYQIQNWNWNWWVMYDGIPVGYYPAKAWTRHYPLYLSRTDAGGEVASLEQNTCSDMGYKGLPGTSNVAAMVNGAWYTNGFGKFNSTFYAYQSDPAQYTTGNWYSKNAFRYGGTGWC